MIDAAGVGWGLLWGLIPLVIVAAVIGIHAQVRSVAALQGAGQLRWRSYATPIAVIAFMGLASAVIGTAAAADVGLRVPVFCPANDVLTTSRHLLWGVMGGTLGGLLILPFYCGVLRPQFEPADFAVVEAVRIGMGLPARIALGGVVEEVVYRWGVLAGVAWLGMVTTGETSAGVRWMAILASALPFGLGHLPGFAGLGIRLTAIMALSALAMNVLLGVIAGWLVWQHGLAAAIAAHSTVHIIWFVLERSGFDRIPGRNG